MDLEDIFIYHLDAELQKLYIRSSRYKPDYVKKAFTSVLRLAFLLCRKRLLIPASHFFESHIGYELISFFEPLLQYDVIHLLSKSGNLDLLLQRKREEYEENYQSNEFHYAQFDKEKGLYLPATLLKREKSSSKELKNEWINSIGNMNVWKPYFDEIDYLESYSGLEKKISKIPERLGNKAYISEHILPLMEVKPQIASQTGRFLNVFITRTYIKNYLLEFQSATALKDIPLINSNEILPDLPGREYISYGEYERKLRKKNYRGKRVLDFILNCTAKELFAFKYSKEWESILHPKANGKKLYYYGGILMTTAPSIKTAVFFALPEEIAAFRPLLSKIEQLDLEIERILGMQGEIGTINGADEKEHQIGLFLLPDYGNNMASIYMTKAKSTFPTIEHVIMCGIAGGIPAKEHIGDIVVSTGGVFQYDLGKNESEKFIAKDIGAPCNLVLRQAVQLYRSKEYETQIPWIEKLVKIGEKLDGSFSSPPEKESYFALQKSTGKYRKVYRKGASLPTVHYGIIGSANCVQKDPEKRDELYSEKKVLAIEMEAAGIRDSARAGEIGFLVVRGICDFCDDGKSDVFHNYASSTAAVYVIGLLETMQDF